MDSLNFGNFNNWGHINWLDLRQGLLGLLGFFLEFCGKKFGLLLLNFEFFNFDGVNSLLGFHLFYEFLVFFGESDLGGALL